MRDFSLTSEPAGVAAGRKNPPRGLPFVIQKHAATRLHYDFRLGWNGVLKSWAVAKGPSYFPGDKRLAVQVEDHPVEYGGFEGTIPKGQYGGGTVMVWDQGAWEPLGDADEGFRKGSLKFVLNGAKLHGKWALIRMNGRASNPAKPNWLLIKEHDEFERDAASAPVIESSPDSVVTGRDIAAIARDEDHVWNSNREEKEQRAPAGRSIKKASSQPSNRVNLTPQARHAPKEALPQFIAPQLAVQSSSPMRGDGWIHELKLDGYRIEARLQRHGKTPVTLLTRTGLDWTHRMEGIADAVSELPVDSALLDGEVVVLRADGTTSFADLQVAFQEGANRPLTYFLFDILHLNGRNLRNLPLEERKRILARLLASVTDEGPLRLSDHLAADARQVFERACKLGAEGIISKLASGKYTSGRGNAWLKLKCYREQELVIGGYTDPSNGSRGVGALLLGYYDAGKLVYAGRTGTGFTQKAHHLMHDRLRKLARKTPPFDRLPRGVSRGVHWVDPKLVAQISFSNWTRDDLVRQAAFRGLREDKPAREVTREELESSSPKTPGRRPRARAGQRAQLAAAVPNAAKSVPRAKAPGAKPASVQLPVRLTHPDRVLDVESAVTKQILAEYYFAVADRILSHIADRPLSLVRCPDGSAQPCFFQKHKNNVLPDEIGSIDIVDRKSGKKEPYITVSTVTGLLGLAQMSVLEVHPWGSRNSSLETPDRIVFDLDPDADISWRVLADSALDVRRRLDKFGLASYVKLTGGKGLHVVVPIRPEQEWPAVKQFAHGVVLAMEKENPGLYLTRMTKSARKGKIYLDYLRNDRGATSVAAYSPRARPGMAVSIPLRWSELKADERPVFSVADLAAWESRLARDPWKDWKTEQDLPAKKGTAR